MGQIGAGTRILMGDAAAPHNLANGGSDANLDDVTEYFTSFSFTNPMGTVDITTLKADLDAYARKFIAGLRNATVSGAYIEQDAGCDMLLRLDAISNGVVHPAGRGKVDFRLLIGGDNTGNAQVDGTLIVTDGVGTTVEIESPLGNSFSGQVDGELEISAQS